MRWLERMSSRVVLRALRSAGVLVCTSMPSATCCTQAAARPRTPLASTRQMRQEAMALIFLR